MNADNKKKLIGVVALVIIIVAALVIIFIPKKSDQQKASEWNEEKLSEANQENKWEEYSLSEKVKYYKDNFGIDVPEKALNFEEMHKTVNKDIYAWLYSILQMTSITSTITWTDPRVIPVVFTQSPTTTQRISQTDRPLSMVIT